MFVAGSPQRAVDPERGCEVASVDREHVRYRDDSIEGWSCLGVEVEVRGQ